MYKVDIIIPVYNVSEYIAESIKSVINQTYKNIEIILVNDGSLDDSIEKAKTILNNSKVSYKIIEKENGGLPAARNTGINNSTAEYLCFIDSDDVISPCHIEYLVNLAEMKSLNVCFSDFEFTSESNRFGKIDDRFKFTILDTNTLLWNFMKRKPPIHCCSLLIKRDYILDNKIIFNEQLRKYGEDVEFMWRLFPSLDKIGHVLNPSYKYLIRNNSIMTSSNIESGLLFIKVFKDSIDESIKKYPEYKKTIKKAYCRTIMGWIRNVASNVSFDSFQQVLQEVDNNIITQLLFFPDVRVIISAILLLKKPVIFYSILNRGKKC